MPENIQEPNLPVNPAQFETSNTESTFDLQTETSNLALETLDTPDIIETRNIVDTLDHVEGPEVIDTTATERLDAVETPETCEATEVYDIMEGVSEQVKILHTQTEVNYYFKGERHSTLPSHRLDSWFEAFGIDSDLIKRSLEIIQVLETGRGSVRSIIKSVARKISEIGFIDEIKSRGLLQMRANFVTVKILKDFILSSNPNTKAANELRERLKRNKKIMGYVLMQPAEEQELNRLFEESLVFETGYDRTDDDQMLSDFKKIITFKTSGQIKRNRDRWSLMEIKKLLDTNPEYKETLSQIDQSEWSTVFDSLKEKTSKERIFRIINVLIYLKKSNPEDFNSKSKEYLDLKSQILNKIAPRDTAVKELKRVLEKEDGVSVLIAAELLRGNLVTLEKMAKSNQEHFDVRNNWIAMRMFLNSYNRGINKVTLSIIENWVYEFSKLAIDPESQNIYLNEKDIDGTFKTVWRREQLLQKIELSFVSTCVELKTKTDLFGEYNFMDFLECAKLIKNNSSRIEFISHPLVQGLKQYYFQKTNKNLSVVFSEEQLKPYYFTYGAKVLRSEEDFTNL